VQGCLLSIGLTYVLVNLLTDVVYRWVNPRMRRLLTLKSRIKR
jgi:ABC-type dipeptide/oligopeptide/nickel transport system permease component